MIYFLLPKSHYSVYRNIDYTSHHEVTKPIISMSLSHYLCDIKERICMHEKDWDSYKKYTNPYEYIHTIVPNKKKSISKHKPLSRSYFKMIELINILHLCPIRSSKEDSLKQFHGYTHINTKSHVPIQCFHLAEGPGGFIEAISELRNNPNDKYYGMTIQDDTNIDVPAWKKSSQFLKDNPNVIIENGADGTGNILNLQNLVYCKEKYGSSMDFITADGGFDFSVDFNHQENAIAKLLFAQIAYALVMQKKDGNFVLKIFDSFMQHSADLLYILSSMYDKVYICKPQTSRFANSEKYIVCKKFIFPNHNTIYPYLYNTFARMVTNDMNVYRFLICPVPNYFLTKMEEYNSIFGQQQIENIYNTILLMETKHKSDKIDQLIKHNIQKSTNWCIKNNVEYNVINNNTNVFLGYS